MGSRSLDRRILRQVPLIRWTVSASVAIGVLSTAAVVVQALALASLLAGAMPGVHVGHPTAALVWLAAAVALRGLCALGGELVARVGASWTKAELRRRLLIAALRRVPAGGGTGAGDLATVAGRGIDALDVFVGRCLPDFVLAAVAPVALVVAVGALDWVSALVIAAALVLFPVFGALVGRASSALAEQRWHQVEGLGRQIVDVFEGMAVLKALGRSRQQRARIEQAGESLRRASLGTLRVAFLSAFVLDELASISVALVAVPLGLRLIGGTVPLTAALAVLIVAPEVFLPLRRASAEFHQSTEGLAALGSVAELLASDDDEAQRAHRVPSGAGAPEAASGGSAAAPLPCPRRGPGGVSVALRSVKVVVAGRARPVLDDADLAVGPGETVVMVGPNGAGKSTILSLLLGFSTPASGSVVVDGHDLRQLDLDAWRSRIAYLPEHPTLLAGTLAENLRLADPWATDEKLCSALADAGAGRWLDELDDGLDVRLGEGGRPISAGQRQRVALARMALRPASLYLLDEPTAHLDAEAEATVIEYLRRTLEGCSALVVTHRKAVMDIADRIVTVDGGRVVAWASASSEVLGLPA